MNTTPMLSVAQAAAHLNVHPATIRRMIGRGELPAKRVGRVWRINIADLEPERRTLTGHNTQPHRVIVTMQPQVIA